MNISEKIQDRFKQNLHLVRRLSENSADGILACGYVEKNRKQGSHVDYLSQHYGGLMIVSGEGVYTDDTTEEIPIRAGDFVQRFPNRKHSTFVTSDDWIEIYIIIGYGMFNQLSSLGMINLDKPVLTTGLDFSLIEQVLKFVEQFEQADSVELPNLMADAISIISRANYLDKKNSHPTNVVNMLELSLKYIEDNICNRIEVVDIANYVHMGFEKYRKIFTSHYGKSPGIYIIQRRIHFAQKLLSENKLSIKEIAIILGYSDAYTFSKQFRKMMGISPSEYKKTYIL